MITALQPYLIWIKIAGIVIILGAIGIGGYRFGYDRAEGLGLTAIAKVQNEYDAFKVQTAETKSRMALDAKNALVAQEEQNTAEQAAKQSHIDSLTTKYQAVLKDAQNAKRAALAANANPTITADPLTDGMWVDVQSASCTGNPDRGGLVSQAAGGGRFADSQRCRLSQSTADRLVEGAASADELVHKYNEAVETIKTLTAPSASQATKTVVDTQGATK